jgi:hypothetical protein
MQIEAHVSYGGKPCIGMLSRRMSRPTEYSYFSGVALAGHDATAGSPGGQHLRSASECRPRMALRNATGRRGGRCSLYARIAP